MKSPPLYFGLLFVFFTFVVICTLWFHAQSGHYQGDAEFCVPTGGSVEVISWSPRILVHKNFITKAEADYLIRLGRDKLDRSTVVSQSGDLSNHRTSSGTFLSTDNDPIVMGIEQRIAEWSLLPVEHGENFYLLRYQQGEKYEQHYDSFPSDSEELGNSGNRVKTLIIYLQKPNGGGETNFPRADVTVDAEVGDAVLFYNMNPNGSTDPMALHEGTPVTSGEKWIITKWIREKPYEFNWYADQQRKYLELHNRPMGTKPPE